MQRNQTYDVRMQSKPLINQKQRYYERASPIRSQYLAQPSRYNNPAARIQARRAVTPNSHFSYQRTQNLMQTTTPITWRERNKEKVSVKNNIRNLESDKKSRLYEERDRPAFQDRNERRYRSSLRSRPTVGRELEEPHVNQTYHDGISPRNVYRSNSRRAASRTNRRVFYDRIKNSSPIRTGSKENQKRRREEEYGRTPKRVHRSPKRLERSPNRSPKRVERKSQDYRREEDERGNMRNSLRRSRKLLREKKNEFKNPKKSSGLYRREKIRPTPLMAVGTELEDEELKKSGAEHSHFNFKNLRSINPGIESEKDYGNGKLYEGNKERSFIGKISKEEYKRRVGDGFRRYMYDCSKHLDTAFRLRKDKDMRRLEPPIPIYLQESNISP